MNRRERRRNIPVIPLTPGGTMMDYFYEIRMACPGIPSGQAMEVARILSRAEKLLEEYESTPGAVLFDAEAMTRALDTNGWRPVWPELSNEEKKDWEDRARVRAIALLAAQRSGEEIENIAAPELERWEVATMRTIASWFDEMAFRNAEERMQAVDMASYVMGAHDFDPDAPSIQALISDVCAGIDQA